ncbi:MULTISPECIES: hypothetical protein [Staphylococcus]|uniref:hypothetical protein n=1 Tax=Staphylococcus TaxID=1279 RepID=UPI00069FD66C|nr:MULTISPECIES: hypothetical protein [Staphylococcus]MCH4383007.1 hypothetical protein [Staphylococcus haemolyticus]MCH4533526.1 hypothetical protein [Staphylococcus haemolyticus]OFP04567.1 hypothetical protein HMPREF3003_11835 [Staphylococcus sp. HMSC078B01]
MDIIQNKIFLNNKQDLQIIEKPDNTSYYSFIQKYNRNAYEQFLVDFDTMLKIMQYFILKYRAEIKELNLLINDEEYRDEIRYRIKQVNSNNEEFINFINYLKALYEEESEEINKLCIKYRVNNELFKWYIYMNGLIEIENGKKEDIINDLKTVIVKNEKICN